MHPQDTKCTPSQSKSQFLGQFLLGALDLEMYLDGLWGRRLKKGRQLFWQKSAPPDKILATPMLHVLNDDCRNIACKQQTPVAYYRSREHVRYRSPSVHTPPAYTIYTQRPSPILCWWDVKPFLYQSINYTQRWTWLIKKCRETATRQQFPLHDTRQDQTCIATIGMARHHTHEQAVRHLKPAYQSAFRLQSRTTSLLHPGILTAFRA